MGLRIAGILILATVGAGPLAAADGKLLATGGATSIEGAAGGGITTWALIGGYGTSGESSIQAVVGYADTGNYTLSSTGVAASWNDRVELSWARQTFRLGDLGVVLGDPDARLRQDVFGVKVRLAGDVIYTPWPQIAAGVQYKRNLDFELPRALGAVDDSGLDVYVGASKAWLGLVAGRNLLLNVTARATQANELGILGFGGDLNDGHEVHLEGAAGVFVSPAVIVGLEYRSKPRNLSFTDESDWADMFVGWFPDKRIGLVAAITDLGTIATLENQGGLYVSVQASF